MQPVGKGHGRAQQKATLSCAPLALTVSNKFSINLSASGGEQGEIRVGTVQVPMQKGSISARSRRRSGGCFASWKRTKPNAKSDHFGAVWTQVRRVFRFLEACKTRCQKRPFRRGLDAGPEAVPLPCSVQNPMPKATISARSGRFRIQSLDLVPKQKRKKQKKTTAD